MFQLCGYIAAPCAWFACATSNPQNWVRSASSKKPCTAPFEPSPAHASTPESSAQVNAYGECAM